MNLLGIHYFETSLEVSFKQAHSYDIVFTQSTIDQLNLISIATNVRKLMVISVTLCPHVISLNSLYPI